MNNKLYMKVVVAGVLILFFGASIATSGNENIELVKTSMPLDRVEYLLIPDSTAHTVGMYDLYDGSCHGDVINGSGIFSTPINAILGPDGNIYISDQLKDSVFVFDGWGNYLSTYADASDGLNNIRGIDFRDGHLFVTSGDDYVAEFDGPHSRLPDFINDGSDPFDILFLEDGRALLSDIQGSTDNVRLYNQNGTFAYKVFSVNFPEQIQFDSLSPGAYLNACLYDSVITDFELDGTIVQTTPLSSARGVYRLGNGNLLATNDRGVWELDPGTGNVIDQKSNGSARYIEYYSGVGNNWPYEPSNPNPEDGAVDVSIDTDLSWTGGDPDPGDNVTYDVYFGNTSSPPQVVTGLSETTYNPELDYLTTYYWQIVAWDNHDAYIEGPVWEFTTAEPEPDLYCEGSLSWTNVTPGDTVTGSFTVENIGAAESLLDWEIESYPDWGEWTFNPESGEDLTPEDGVRTILVEVIAPDEEEETFTGEVKIVNTENPDDLCIIPASLVTPVNKQSSQSNTLLNQQNSQQSTYSFKLYKGC